MTNFSSRIQILFRGGFGLVEVVVVTGIFLAVFFGFSQAGILSLKLLRAEKENLVASLLGQETIEAVRSLRDESWSDNIAALANGTPYYPIIENGKWKLVSSDPGMINSTFRRYALFEQVFRKSSAPGLDQIANPGAETYDDSANTRKVTSVVTWGASRKDIATYIANFPASLGSVSENKTVFFEDAPTDADLANFPSDNSGDGDPSQSFTVSSSALLVGKIELYLRRVTLSPSNIYLEIRTAPAGFVLGTSNLINSSTIINGALAWVEFRFSLPVSLNAETRYYLRLKSVPDSTLAGSGSAGIINWGYRQTAGSPYAGGEARKNVGKLSPADEGQILADYDFGFRVYSLQ